MNPTFMVPVAQREQIITEAITRRCPLSLSCKVSQGWITFHSRLLGASLESRQLVIEYPSRDGGHGMEFMGGEHLGISFRRGPKRCVFNAMVVGQCRYELSRGTEVPALRISWPDEVHELQRRMFYRAPVPEGRFVPVSLMRVTPNGENPLESFSGQLLDVSLGGLSIAFDRGRHPRWDYDTVVECSFTPTAAEPPIGACGRVRYVQPMGDRYRVGVQFVGLEATSDGSAVLERLRRICTEYQQLEMSRLGYGGLIRPAQA